MKIPELPSGTWVEIAADLCELNNKQYLVVTDYYSRYIEIAYLPKTTIPVVTETLKNMFCTWGDPEVVMSDNAKQFTSPDFKHFAKERDFKQIFSSPHYNQGNGEAVAGVKNAKSILRQKNKFSALRFLSTFAPFWRCFTMISASYHRRNRVSFSVIFDEIA